MADEAIMPPPPLPLKEVIYEIVGKKRRHSGSSGTSACSDDDLNLKQTVKKATVITSNRGTRGRSLSATRNKTATGKIMTTSNAFSALSGVSTHPSDMETNSVPLLPAPKHRVKPICVQNSMSHKALLELLVKACPEPKAFTVKPHLANSSITPSSINSYRAITDMLDAKGIEYFTFPTVKTKVQKFVIRGLSINTDPEDIASELVELGIKVKKVMQLYYKTPNVADRKMPLFETTLHGTIGQPAVDLSWLTRLQHCVVTIEAPRTKKPDITQCFRCQRLGHNQEFCRQKFRCVRCGGEHELKECRHSRDDPICCNCNQNGHAACSRVCEVIQRVLRLRQQRQTNITSSQGERTLTQPTSVPQFGHHGQRAQPRQRLEMPSAVNSDARLQQSSRTYANVTSTNSTPTAMTPDSEAIPHTGIAPTRTSATPMNPSQVTTSAHTITSTPEAPVFDMKSIALFLADWVVKLNIHPILTSLAKQIPNIINLLSLLSENASP